MKEDRTEVDVLVVGAGPGGAATAYHLAKHGVNVLAMDKARFPREKVCGDGLTPRGVRAMQRMGVDPTDPGFVPVDGLRMHGAGVVLTLPWPELSSFPRLGLVRTRHDFDHLLVQQAEKVGALVWEEAEATAPIRDSADWVTGATVTVEGEERTVAARYVVAADGAASRFGARAGVVRDDTKPLGVAARRYYRTPARQEPWLDAWLDLDERGVTLPGYGWVFPLGDGVLNVGAGLLNTFRDFKDISARRVFDAFIAMLHPSWEVSEETAMAPVLSGPLPMGMNRRPLARRGLLLVGDAGGIVNPFNGEGIAYAMETGEVAADLIFESLAHGRPAIAHLYPQVLRERYGRYFAVGGLWAKAIGVPRVMRLATRLGLPHEMLMRFAMRILAGLTDGKEGDAADKVVYALTRLER